MDHDIMRSYLQKKIRPQIQYVLTVEIIVLQDLWLVDYRTE